MADKKPSGRCKPKHCPDSVKQADTAEIGNAIPCYLNIDTWIAKIRCPPTVQPNSLKTNGIFLALSEAIHGHHVTLNPAYDLNINQIISDTDNP